jgi:multiple sugar transport system substrate-binding protein
VQLVYQDWRTPWFPAMAQEMLAKFSAEHPNIHVFYTPDPENLQDTMVADFQAGTAPDVLAGCCDFFAAWAQAGYLMDLRPFVQADLPSATVNDWDKAQVNALFTEDGQQFALPKYHGALALYYNRDLFDRIGLEPPSAGWDLDAYAAAQAALTTPSRSGSESATFGSMLDISWDRIQVHVNAWGGHLVDPNDPRRSRLADPESLAAHRWLRDRIWGDRTMASPLDVGGLTTREAFAAGRVAMVEDGSWALKDILEQAPFRIGVAPMPRGPKRRVTLATIDGFAIYSGTRYPEAAWELLKFLTSPEYGRAMAESHLLQPARASLVDEWVRIAREQYPDATKGLDLAAFAEGHVAGYSVTGEVFANMGDARRLAQEAWQRILALGQAPVELLVEVSEQIERLQSQPAV